MINGTPDEKDKSNILCIEIIYYPDSFPSIKSYYLMTNDEFEDLKALHMDMYIENFIGNDDLTKDKLDIHIVNNNSNIKIFKDFLDMFGNSFDILNLIYAKKLNQSDKNSQKHVLLNNFSDNETKLRSSEQSSVLDSDEYINVMTEMIDKYNKSQTIDDDKLKILIQNKPHLVNDEILSEISGKKSFSNNNN